MAHKYRELHIPVDNIVQDWFWWTTKGEFVVQQELSRSQGHDRRSAPQSIST